MNKVKFGSLEHLKILRDAHRAAYEGGRTETAENLRRDARDIFGQRIDHKLISDKVNRGDLDHPEVLNRFVKNKQYDKDHIERAFGKLAAKQIQEQQHKKTFKQFIAENRRFGLTPDHPIDEDHPANKHIAASAMGPDEIPHYFSEPINDITRYIGQGRYQEARQHLESMIEDVNMLHTEYKLHQNLATPGERYDSLRDQYVHDDDYLRRVAVAAGGNDKHLDILKNDEDPEVRLNVAKRGNIQHKLHLANDEDPDVKRAARL